MHTEISRSEVVSDKFLLVNVPETKKLWLFSIKFLFVFGDIVVEVVSSACNFFFYQPC